MQNKYNSIKNTVLAELKKQMKPELLNRLDCVIVFNALSEAEIKKIAVLGLEDLKKRLEKQGVTLSCENKLIDCISRKSIAFEQGARQVRKNIQDLIENKIAKMIVEGKVKNGKISLEVKRGKIIFS
jgi:ATP-dependent Clp protease ATP-binding subunit ClpA